MVMMSSDSLDDFSGGDLGLGDGLKPGVLLITPSPNPESDEGMAATTVPFLSESESVTNGSTGFTTPEDSDDEYEISLMPIPSIKDLKSQFAQLKNQSSRSVETNPNIQTLKEESYLYDSRYFQCDVCGGNSDSKTECSCKKEDNSVNGNDTEPSFPVYANVQYGTSIRQQKELYKHNIEELQKKMGSCPSQNCVSSNDSINSKNRKSSKKKKNNTEEEIALKLAETLQEVEDLKFELDTCEQRLDSKYQAISILRKQADLAHMQLRNKEKYSKETTLKLSQEINRLHGDLDYQENSILNSEQTWAQRFDSPGGEGAGDGRVASLVVAKEYDLGDSAPRFLHHCSTDEQTNKPKDRTVPIEKHRRICKDNASLMATLETRTEELRKVTAQKMAVERENDELLALLDIQERAKYERTRSVSSDENYCTFTSTELAVLGACRCRVTEPDPCGCAHAAANLKREIIRMKEELSLFKTRRDEAYLTVDAYRKAFEEQLQRNKVLTLQLASIGSSPNAKTTKTKSAFRWLISSLTDDEISEDFEPVVPRAGSTMSDAEMIIYLTDVLHEKKEVLAHQKLAAQIVADRVKKLESKLAEYESNGDKEVFH